MADQFLALFSARSLIKKFLPLCPFKGYSIVNHIHYLNSIFKRIHIISLRAKFRRKTLKHYPMTISSSSSKRNDTDYEASSTTNKRSRTMTASNSPTKSYEELKEELRKEMERRAAIAVEKLYRRKKESRKIKRKELSDEAYEKKVVEVFQGIDREIAKIYKIGIDEVAAVSTELDLPLHRERLQMEEELKKVKEELEQEKQKTKALLQKIHSTSSSAPHL